GGAPPPACGRRSLARAARTPRLGRRADRRGARPRRVCRHGPRRPAPAASPLWQRYHGARSGGTVRRSARGAVPEFRITDLVDVLFVALLLWAALSFVRRARARIALAGVAISGALYVLARYLELQLTVWILQGFFAVLVLVLVVVFQEDLRRLFEQIAVWG